ncbi:HD domain-containing phosphohydrolase [Clostridium sp. JNZ J1-5]
MKKIFSLKKQMILNNVLVFILPTLIFAYIIISIFNVRTKKNIEYNNSIIADNINNQVESFIENQINALNQVKFQLISGNLKSNEEINEYLSNITRTHLYIDVIQIINEKGIITNISSLNKDYIGTSAINEEFFITMDKSGRPVFSRVFISAQTHKPTATISLYVNGKLLVENLNLSNMIKIMENKNIDQVENISIIDEKGTYIIDNDDSNVSERKRFKFFNDIKEGIKEKKAIIEVDDSGRTFLYSTKIELTGWYSIISMKYDKIFELVITFKKIFYIGIFTFLIISFSISILSIEMITRSLKSLLEKTKLISSGNYNVQPEYDGYSEFIELYNYFDVMKENIKERENKEKERTNQLNKLNYELDKSNNLLQAILESSPQIISFTLDTNYCHLSFNKKYKETMFSIFNKNVEIGMNILDAIGENEYCHKMKKNCERVMAEESFTIMEEVGRGKDSNVFWQQYWSPVFSRKGKIIGINCFLINISEQKRAEGKIIYLSYHDQLTGLYNRRFFEKELNRLDHKENFPLTLAMGDVNGLKLINDSFGHAVGDKLLIKVAEIITKGCRKNDIIARLGGDEFVILLPKADRYEAEKVINKIKDIASNEKIGSIDISISFGHETKEDENEKIQEIFKSAENHMYKKKLFESPSIRGKTIKAIINTLHEKNKREEQHSHRVSQLCKSMGEALQLSEGKIQELKTVGLLHDIGKIAIEESILNKPSKLTGDEWEQVRRHPEIGYRILNTVNDMTEIAQYVLYHHERWDGSGYPRGLKGKEIPLQSRIITIADSYDAMTSSRSYRDALPEEVAIEELRKNAGIQFDLELTKIFIEKVLKKNLYSK